MVVAERMGERFASGEGVYAGNEFLIIRHGSSCIARIVGDG